MIDITQVLIIPFQFCAIVPSGQSSNKLLIYYLYLRRATVLSICVNDAMVMRGKPYTCKIVSVVFNYRTLSITHLFIPRGAARQLYKAQNRQTAPKK